MNRDELQTFDPNQSYDVAWRRLPHWAQAGTVCFITWRTADSMPRYVVQRWFAEAAELLRSEGIDVDDNGFARSGLNWKSLLHRLTDEKRCAVQFALTERWDAHLDACHGKYLLKQRELAQIVADSLRKFDGDRYELTDFVVMPNHVHLLVAFRDERSLLAQCASWKRFTARRINSQTGDCGEFWQHDAFDHLVRSAEQFGHYRRYIANNGPQANLSKNDYLWFSKM